jgi:hypothetical protein
MILGVLGLGAGVAPSPAQPPPGKAQDVTGPWTGIWGPYNPAQSATLAKEKCKALDCRVTHKDGVWQATFEGECGRPYKFVIKMEGRQVGNVVLFKGTTDLGAKEGGVFDWVGQATDKEFVGFYTSSHYTGVFHLSRRK